MADLPAPPPAPVPVEPEVPAELEGDEPADEGRPKLEMQVGFNPNDLTLNVMPSVSGNLLMPLTDGGLQFLLAGGRANVGVTGGRYLFEVRILEVVSNTDMLPSRLPQPWHQLRIGFATANSSPFIGSTTDSVCFDSDGNYTHDGKASMASQKFGRGQVIGILLNLDSKSPNANTVSLFRDGLRVSQPQVLPECLKGKPLFPAVTFRNISVHVNFGPQAMARMPFTCKMVQEAASGDVTTNPHVPPPDGKYQVIFPVGLPDEGVFDWADNFMASHPEFTELSDRKILEWASSSGLLRHQGYMWKASNDKPEMNFSIPQMDDFSIQRVLSHVAPTQPRNLLVMEVRANLMKEDRTEALKRFCHAHFKKVAVVVVGEPPLELKEKAYAELLKVKQEVLDKEYQVRCEEKQRAKMVRKQQRLMEKERRKREREARRLAAEEAKRLKEAEAMAKSVEDGEKKEGETKDGDQKNDEAEKAAEKEEEDEEDDDKDDDKDEDEPEDVEMKPVATLTEEDKKNWFRKPVVPDLTPWTLSSSFVKFSLPTKEEGFDEQQHEWYGKSKSVEYVRTWVLDRKLTTRIEDIQPSDWFKLKWATWQNELKKWHTALNDWKDPMKQLALTAEAAQGEEKPEQKAAEPATNAMDVDDVEVDIFAIQDVLDIGKGEPLFSKFEFEDWALMSLRFELHLLVHAFRHDVDDPERLGIIPENLSFYYSRYFRKALNTTYYGVDSFQQLIDLIKDTVSLDSKSNVLVSHLSSELDRCDLFVKLTEECRRERILMIDNGDPSLKLKFSKPTVQAAVQYPPQQMLGQYGGCDGGFGGGGGFDRHAPYKGGKMGFSGKGYGAKSTFGKTAAPYGKSGGRGFGPPQSNWSGGDKGSVGGDKGGGGYSGPPASFPPQQRDYYGKSGGASNYKGGKSSFGGGGARGGGFSRSW